MKFEYSFFKSKVARRFYYLFIISALIPIVFLASFQFIQMTRESDSTFRKDLKESTKTIGMDLIGRLFYLGNQMQLLGIAISKLSLDVLMSNKETLYQMAPEFSALTYIEGEKVFNLKGKTLSLPPSIKFTEEKIAIWIKNNNSNNSEVYLINKLGGQNYLLGLVGDLGQFDIPSDAYFWILGPEGEIIFSNTTIKLPEEFWQVRAKNESGVFNWQQRVQRYYVGYWSLFLKQRLQSDNWVVVFAQPVSILASYTKNIYQIYLPAIIFALLLTMFLSQSQIRRLLIPLEKLSKATLRIAKRDFLHPVKIESKDEFEDLSLAFNSMSSELYQQFKILGILSLLDRSIIINKSGEVILEIIFDNLQEAFHYDLLAFGILKDKFQVEFKVKDAKGLSANQKVRLKSSEIKNMTTRHEVTFDLHHEKLPDYLSFLEQYNLGFMLLFPIFHQKKLKALMVLGFKTSQSVAQFKDKEIKDIFYRAQIAFDHAEWEQKLFHQAHYDDLTNLPNRILLREIMAERLQVALQRKLFCAMLFIDLDNFKNVNDTFGHSVGDKFLEKVAKRMLKHLGENALLARIGGDEFTLFLYNFKNLEEATQYAANTAKKILTAFEEPFIMEKMEYYAGASIGISIFPKDCEHPDELFRISDIAMYRAKASGKNCFEFFTSQLEEMVVKRNELLQDLHMAVSEKQFFVHYQPKINTLNGEMVGAEVLIRWDHPKKGIIYPDAFLHLAEESNLINALGDILLEKACEQLKIWEEMGYHLLPFALNVAPRQFYKKNLGQKIIRYIKKMELKTTYFEFEVTENALIENFETTAKTLSFLKKHGCQLNIDDFGKGYSSMQYLTKLPLDVMKIDKFFIEGLPQDKKNLSIVKAIKTLADNLNLKVVAEGIETKAQSLLLASLGCNIQQGYYFSKPLGAQEFAAKFLKK